MSNEDKIAQPQEYRGKLLQWRRRPDADLRSFINQHTVSVRREVLEAGCYHTVTVSPPPALGGYVMRDLDPFTAMFDPPYRIDLVQSVVDMVDRAIGVLRVAPSEPPAAQPKVYVDLDVQKGYAFIAMPMDPEDLELADVLDAIKEAARRCGIHAERVDEPQSNDRVTDRILESIRKAEYVIVDLTKSKPNVCYEAGYAYGIGKIPIYVARHGTPIEFDLKDYPIIFFKNMTQLKDLLEKRLRGLPKPGPM